MPVRLYKRSGESSYFSLDFGTSDALIVGVFLCLLFFASFVRLGVSILRPHAFPGHAASI